jgi:hypothetical protein
LTPDTLPVTLSASKGEKSMSQVTIEFPFLVKVEDYHSLEIIRQSLKKAGVNCSFLDIGLKRSKKMPFLSNYVGLFFVGDLYSKENQDKLNNIEEQI